MARKDQLAQGAAKASYGPMTFEKNSFGQTYEDIFGKPEVGLFKDSKAKPSKKI